MSGFRFGCGCEVLVTVPRGYTCRTITYKCGSTGPYGDVVQCDDCAKARPTLPVREDESDEDWYARQEDYLDRTPPGG